MQWDSILSFEEHSVSDSLTPQDYIGLVLVYAIIGISLAVALALDRRGSSVDSRKVVHIGVGTFVFVWWIFSENWIMLVFFTLPFAVLLFIAMLKDNAVSNSKIGDLANNKGHKTGLFLYAVSITILVAFFFDHWTAATIGIVAMTWGDGLGSVVGKRFGKHPTLNGKSLEGSIGVFVGTAVMAIVIMLFYGWLTVSGFYPGGDSIAIVPIWAVAVIAGFIATVLEAICPGQYDNIVIPIVVAVAMVLLGL